jgi:hypothetical protein
MPDDLIACLRTALESRDIDQLSALLAPDVTWGAPDEPDPPCRNREQVIRWYQRGFDDGVRVTVDVGDGLLVGMLITGSPAANDAGGELERWQFLAITEDRVSDIRGFEDRASALLYATRRLSS